MIKCFEKYHSCVFPAPGQPHNSVTFDNVMPPPKISSKALHEVDIGMQLFSSDSTS